MIHFLNKYLIIIFPIFLVIGPALSDIAVSVLSISYIYICFREKYYNDFQIWIVKLLIIFWLYCICRSILSADPLLSLESSLFYGRFMKHFNYIIVPSLFIIYLIINFYTNLNLYFSWLEIYFYSNKRLLISLYFYDCLFLRKLKPW